LSIFNEDMDKRILSDKSGRDLMNQLAKSGLCKALTDIEWKIIYLLLDNPGLSQEQLAEAVGTSQPFISQYRARIQKKLQAVKDSIKIIEGLKRQDTATVNQ